MLCIASSCKDQNFDWDAAHATEQYQKFTDVFIKEFGKPAPGHQWGFDAANAAITGINTSTAVTRADGESDGYVWKQEMYINNVPAVVQYGKPADITPREHLEVYAWFLMHKVYWSNAPVNFNIDTKEPTRQTVDNTNTAYVRTNLDGYTMTYEQALTKVNQMAKAEGLKNSDGTDFQLDRLSFRDAAYNNEVDDYVFDTNLYFRNAWIQHVANDNNIVYDDDEKNYEDQIVTSAQMDYLRCWALTSDDAGKWGIHLFDYLIHHFDVIL
ncbi:MAG: hypothetical protein MJ060_05490 [Clostridia bacterium]|nr:hypothetical protein [Clostridia bacterium]